jgi:CRISPR system Cascade subunit CasE
MIFHMSRIKSHENMTDPQRAHAVMSACFRRDEGRALFRVEAPDSMLVVSRQPPAGIASVNIETKRVKVDIRNGLVARFKLRANPTTVDAKGSRHGIMDAYGQYEWLANASAKAGFSVEKVSIRPEGMMYRRGAALWSVFYDGVLRVTDDKLFEQAFLGGIGRSKAFGCGMLSIRPE